MRYIRETEGRNAMAPGGKLEHCCKEGECTWSSRTHCRTMSPQALCWELSDPKSGQDTELSFFLKVHRPLREPEVEKGTARMGVGQLREVNVLSSGDSGRTKG